ncbi:MAG: dihydropteroate synthase [Nitriliruptoraceae bacterium]
MGEEVAPLAPPDVVAAGFRLETSSRTLVQAVLNVTPDSFFDGGRHLAADHPATAVRHGAALLEAGADLVDVGGESTRPGAGPVDVDEELHRVVPVIRALARDGACVSVDTTKAAVAHAAIEAGAAIVNDVSAGALDDALLDVVAEADAAYVLMHMQGTPRTMQQAPIYRDVVDDVRMFLAERLDVLAERGIARERVIVDPGIGFGKTAAHNVALLRGLARFTTLGRPVLVGASRKSFLGALTGLDDPEERLEASVAAAVVAVLHGASMVRVHDVAATVRAVAVADAVARGRGEGD